MLSKSFNASSRAKIWYHMLEPLDTHKMMCECVLYHESKKLPSTTGITFPANPNGGSVNGDAFSDSLKENTFHCRRFYSSLFCSFSFSFHLLYTVQCFHRIRSWFIPISLFAFQYISSTPKNDFTTFFFPGTLFARSISIAL